MTRVASVSVISSHKSNRSYLLSLVYGKDAKYYNEYLTHLIDTGKDFNIAQQLNKVEQQFDNFDIPLYNILRNDLM